MRHINKLNSVSDTLHPAQVNTTAELGSCFALTTNKQGASLRNRNGFSEIKQEHALACEESKSIKKKCSKVAHFWRK